MRYSNNKVLVGVFCCLATPAFALDDLFSLSLEELSGVNVSIATGTVKPLAQAPAGASVVTAEEIAMMGAQTLDEVLETIPGVHVSRGSFGLAPRYFIRGIVSTYNPQTLVLLNGVPMTSLFLGDRGERNPNEYSLPIKTVERIEVIRGPGSALYGADAFAGVINVITKSADDIDGTELSASWGSFDTSRASILSGQQVGELKVAVALSHLSTKGDDSAIIDSDLQSVIDPTLAQPASRAPEAAATSVKYFDARVDMELQDWRWRVAWNGSKDAGTGQGINDALDPDSRFEYYRASTDLGWHNDDLLNDWEIDVLLSYAYAGFNNPTGIYLFPPGADFGLGAFPDGVRAKPELKEENVRANVNFLYKGFDNHTVLLGSGYLWADLFETHDTTNYTSVLAPRGELVDISDTADVFQPEDSRQSHYLFIQDEWQFASRWELIAGLRYDSYSDVGGTANPRLALVWSTTDTFTTKLLYGEAFRAPAFFELYATNNPVALGNPDLDPESLRSTELAFDWRPISDWALALNLYHWRITDYIDFLADPGTGTFTAQNSGKIDGYGLEAEVRHQLSRDVNWLVNYSYQHTKDEDSGEPLGFMPTHQGYARVAWEFMPRWQWAPQLTWVGERLRAAGDSRDALRGYVSADMSLRKRWKGNIDVALIARNMFNADIREPSRGPTSGQQFASFENDLPQQGRSVTIAFSAPW
ncbi:MAG: TonB-dependent receptor [Gammaproteobacteria bacterium]|nr:TonB-dependent receptor [Gammaproteobacteria bacterium]MBQ0773060.1 TonB-dependent receptor [Gammaproteobacteria bacterium]